MVNKCAVFATMLCAAALSSTPHLQAQQSAVKNIVLVHGAWADGSGWKGVYNILVKDGFNVSIVQEPETSFQDDVTAVKRILALQDGPSILVAHSYGGSVITEAGTDPSVAGLVYIAAHMPDAGENEGDDGKRFPSDLGKSGALKKTADGFTYLDPAQFHEYFAADLSVEQAAFMARSQVLNFASNFSATITTAAWRTKRETLSTSHEAPVVRTKIFWPCGRKVRIGDSAAKNLWQMRGIVLEHFAKTSTRRRRWIFSGP
jgi:pimeloyl-ACP methyl ester carboxylesterase